MIKLRKSDGIAVSGATQIWDSIGKRGGEYQMSLRGGASGLSDRVGQRGRGSVDVNYEGWPPAPLSDTVGQSGGPPTPPSDDVGQAAFLPKSMLLFLYSSTIIVYYQHLLRTFADSISRHYYQLINYESKVLRSSLKSSYYAQFTHTAQYSKSKYY